MRTVWPVVALLAACGARSSILDDDSQPGAGPLAVTVAAGTTSTGGGGECPAVADALPVACAAYACELEHAASPACAACLNTAAATTCEREIRKATRIKGRCADANACALGCDGADMCGCVAACMEGEKPRCARRWADAFGCLASACAAECG